MPHQPNVLCAGSCGRLLWSGGRGDLPAGEKMCRECGRAANSVQCPGCGCALYRTRAQRAAEPDYRCRACIRADRRSPKKRHLRASREHSSRAYRVARARLRAEKLQPCCLCGEEIDYDFGAPLPESFAAEHVKPVRHGGTWEDGLFPSHLGCQRRQGGQFIGARFDPDYIPRSEREPVVRRAPRLLNLRGEQLALKVCVCGVMFSGHKRTCSDPECEPEYQARWTRDRYRARVGLPVDASKPTSKWRRRTRERVA